MITDTNNPHGIDWILEDAIVAYRLSDNAVKVWRIPFEPNKKGNVVVKSNTIGMAERSCLLEYKPVEGVTRLHFNGENVETEAYPGYWGIFEALDSVGDMAFLGSDPYKARAMST